MLKTLLVLVIGVSLVVIVSDRIRLRFSDESYPDTDNDSRTNNTKASIRGRHGEPVYQHWNFACDRVEEQQQQQQQQHHCHSPSSQLVASGTTK